MSNDVPSATQIRAALAMLKWENDELAAAAGIGTATAFNVKMGNNQPQPRIRAKIRAALEGQGLEFLDNDGVRRRPEGVDVLNGREGLVQFLDEVYEYLKAHGGIASATGIDERQWMEAYGEENCTKHFARMEALLKERSDVKIRSLTREGFYPASTSSYTEYRWISRDRFATVPFYLCGDKLGILVFQSDPPPKILLIRSAVIADAYRQQFEELWEGAKQLPHKKAPTDA